MEFMPQSLVTRLGIHYQYKEQDQEQVQDQQWHFNRRLCALQIAQALKHLHEPRLSIVISKLLTFFLMSMMKHFLSDFGLALINPSQGTVTIDSLSFMLLLACS